MLFIAECGCAAWEEERGGGGAILGWLFERLTVFAVELQQFLRKYGVHRAPRLANYICCRTVHLIRKGCKAILVRRGIDHYEMPVWGLQHLEVTTVHLMLVNRTVKLVAAYPPSHTTLVRVGNG